VKPKRSETDSYVGGCCCGATVAVIVWGVCIGIACLLYPSASSHLVTTTMLWVGLGCLVAGIFAGYWAWMAFQQRTRKPRKRGD